MTPTQRRETLRQRQLNQRPLHSPPHRDSGKTSYLMTAACYAHAPIIGAAPKRLSTFADSLIDTLAALSTPVHAWVILPNHYHVLITTDDALFALKTLGQLHGRSSFTWNGEDNSRGRNVWHNTAETVMKSDAHFQATLNYIHHNPVKHGYVEKWTDWPWSSAAEYLDCIGREEAAKVWKAYPIEDYGAGWDDAEL